MTKQHAKQTGIFLAPAKYFCRSPPSHVGTQAVLMGICKGTSDLQPAPPRSHKPEQRKHSQREAGVSNNRLLSLYFSNGDSTSL